MPRAASARCSARKAGGAQFAGLTLPVAVQAILFDLLNGGEKDWLREPLTHRPPYWDLGRDAALAAGEDFELGTAGVGYGATTVNLKGGLGSASARTTQGFIVGGALVAVNAVGAATIGDGPHFWAGAYEQGSEFGGLGWPSKVPAAALAVRFKGQPLPATATTIALVATDARLEHKAECKRLAIMANDGLARALRPVHAPNDGDTVFAAATGRAAPGLGNGGDPPVLTELGTVAADCLARAIARGVHEATALPYENALPDWRQRFGGKR